MLQLILEVTLSMLTVYGLYCMIINITYIAFCKDKSSVCIAFFKSRNCDIVPDILLAKKAFMGRTRTVILIDYDLDDESVQKIARRNPDSEIYRAERVEKT